MSLIETLIQRLLRQNNVGFVGSLEGKIPADLHIKKDKLVWTIKSSSREVDRVKFEFSLNEQQIKALQEKLP